MHKPVSSDIMHFTGKERDQKSGNDYFGARYYASTTGRFLSPDPSGLAYADPDNPQNLNLYSYVLNNPLIFIDPTGRALQLSCYSDPDTSTTSTDANGNTTVSVTAGKQHCTIWDDGVGEQRTSTLPQQKFSTMTLPSLAANYACQLVAPGGAFNLGPNAVALFQPPMASALTNAFDSLNQQGITPFINSGYRSPADQMRMRNGGSGPNPAAPVSWHEAGMAVDINGTTSSYFPTIVNAMEAQGLTWGGTFRHRDPPHFQLPPAGTRPSAAMVNSCAGAAGGGS